MQNYYDYLQKRHPLSFAYRRRLIYPHYRRMLLGRGLEVGCGLGEFLETEPNFVGVDVNQTIVDHCLEKGLPVECASADHLPYENESFDAILLDNVLEHVEKAVECLRETARVLKPSGRALIIVPNRLGWRRDNTHVKYWDETNLPDLIRRMGLTVIRTRHYPIPLKWLGNLIWSYNMYYVLAQKPSCS